MRDASSRHGGRGIHHERNVVPLEQNPPCQQTAQRGERPRNLHVLTVEPLHIRERSSPRGFLLFFLIDISSASSSTKFMYSSNPCQVSFS